MIREHWTHDRIALVVLGLVCFYVTYVSYRNLKSFLPFVRVDQTGRATTTAPVRPVVVFGNDPAIVLHDLLGTTVSAHALSWVYLLFLPLVPFTVTFWLVCLPTSGSGTGSSPPSASAGPSAPRATT